jgi:Zn-dependent protease with chaperone function
MVRHAPESRDETVMGGVRTRIPQEDFVHPHDKAALKTLQAIPLFTRCLKAYLKFLPEEMLMGLNLAQKIRLGPDQLPKIYRLLPPICAELGIAVPELFLEMNPSPNAYTYGDSKVSITLTSGLIEYVDEDELRAVIAHECGHIVCRHVLYHTMASMVTQIGMTVFGKLAAMALPVQMALLQWDRNSELSADRVAAVVCGGPMPLVHTMIRLSGGPRSLTGEVNVARYAMQGLEYLKMGEKPWDHVLQTLTVMGENHPFTAVRTHEILVWSRTEQFVRLMHAG